MTNDIRTTITDAVPVPAEYDHLVDQAVAALKARDQEIIDALVEVGRAYLPGSDVEILTAILGTGLEYTEPEPEPVVEEPVTGEGGDALAAAMNRFADALESLSNKIDDGIARATRGY